MPSQALAQRIVDHAPRLLTAVLLVAFSAYLVWQGYSLWRMVQAPLTITREATNAPAPIADHSNLRQLFGQPAGSSSEAPATQLNLTLNGSFVHTNPNQSSALISRPGQPAARFGLNARVADGVQLVGIERDHVVLLRNGQHERLSFPTPVSTGAPPATMTMPVQAPQRSGDEHGVQDPTALLERLEQLRSELNQAQDAASAPDQTKDSD